MNLIMIISITLMFFACVWMTYLNKEYKNFSESAVKQTSDNVIKSQSIFEENVCYTEEKRKYFLRLRERYIHALYKTMQHYKQSQKEKNRKLTFKSRVK